MREKFPEDLISYAKQVEEFQYFGNLDELTKYFRKAKALDAKLQAASDKVDKFNREEELFGLEITNYPLRKQVPIHFFTNILIVIYISTKIDLTKI